MKPEPTTARQAAILAIILTSYFMILLDNSVIFTALPSLQADLQLSTGELTWVQDAYTLVFGGLAAQVGAALTTGSILLLLALGFAAVLILPADLAERRSRTITAARPMTLTEPAR